jgi:hypothetical protein
LECGWNNRSCRVRFEHGNRYNRSAELSAEQSDSAGASGIGASIELTTVPGWIGSELASPNVLFDAGWVNWEANGRYTARERITASPMLTHPPAPGTYTALHYSLADGVVATITELRREA